MTYNDHIYITTMEPNSTLVKMVIMLQVIYHIHNMQNPSQLTSDNSLQVATGQTIIRQGVE